MQSPELLKLKEEITRISQKIKNCEKDLVKKKEDQLRQGSEIASLQVSLQDVMHAMEELNEQDNRNTGGRLQLAENQLREYHRM